MNHAGHDMMASTTSMVMSGMSGMMPTATGDAAMASGTGMPMADMDMGMGGCKISMLWNWNTVDSCFISETWRITSTGMFAGSCIGVILLVIALEALRRAGKEYDSYIVRQHLASHAANVTVSSSASSDADASKTPASTTAFAPTVQNFRPSVVQQAIRALLHMLQFAVAYFVMLLAMYYNGYFIICIFIGAYIGYFICGWESFNLGRGGQDRLQPNATVCCG